MGTKTNSENHYVSMVPPAASYTSISGIDDQVERTYSTPESEFIVRENDGLARTPPSLHRSAQKDEVPATIVDIDEHTVLCEVELEGSQIEVRLPRTIFPGTPYYGMPITIAYKVGSSGIRRPIVSTRQVDSESLRQENEEIRALINKF